MEFVSSPHRLTEGRCGAVVGVAFTQCRLRVQPRSSKWVMAGFDIGMGGRHMGQEMV